MAESTKQITFKQKRDRATNRMTYTIKRLFNMHKPVADVRLRIGATYDLNDFKTRFADSKELQGVDIILE